MAIAQLTYRESLRDIQAWLRAAKQETYHMGVRGKISYNTLAQANQTRNWRIYADFAQTLIQKTRQLYADDLLWHRAGTYHLGALHNFKNCQRYVIR
jgi:hypothetical protein